MLKKLFPKKKKGVSEVLLGTMVCIFVLLSVIFVAIFDLQPFFINLRLHSVNRQAVLRMETDGGLSDKTKQYITKSLSDMQGFDSSKLIISASNISDDNNFANYGDTLKLSITYNYTAKKHHLIGWTQSSVENGDILPITVSQETTSKRIKIIDH
ncbi:MAG: hypothetical protein LKF87_11250 [Clostridium tyrobutyricum]|jgi:hypothetical protein|uniref:hypothetical protein n=1 Tax=Clostridium tyrobutyricum TaxID=1519 RepID=UPI00242A3C66|nr:hypothetical protein [Clostridium tyrobutyricum]MCH4200933.1 hypothetical protein [Clostridium tyrobutyricum]MCH4236464.1 hypothetical protein [Clostridium tyrobutyricum]MCH4259516.1 hypothetical protein [Clostridium tyrobutyricum]